jgi:hypothetical protein
MFRNSPVISATYRSFRIEVRLLHAPRGLMSELRLFQQYGANLCLVYCDRAIFRDEEEATRSLARQVCRYVDDLIERNAAA